MFPPLPALFPILKEHQITTIGCMCATRHNCFRFSKNIKSQRCRVVGEKPTHCFRFSKNIKSQRGGCAVEARRDCFRFSKNIKSQHKSQLGLLQATVSDSQRTSNHNLLPAALYTLLLFPILKEHQITTVSSRHMVLVKLFPILKEHQITTLPSQSW